jgi:hypothetical protein
VQYSIRVGQEAALSGVRTIDPAIFSDSLRKSTQIWSEPNWGAYHTEDALMTTGTPVEQRLVSGSIANDLKDEDASSPTVKSATPVSRRRVVRTATKLMYAAPLVVATLKLGAEDAAAQVVSGIRP